MKILLTTIVFGSVIASAGCSNISDAGYYWGDYSETYLQIIRKPSPESSVKHIKQLRKILAKSQSKNLKPPPGINAELAFLLSETEGQGTPEEIANLYSTEAKIYPESKVFIEKLTGASL